MSIFCYKKIERGQRLGDRFGEARSAKGVSILQIATELRIQTKYLQALEDCRYEVLPNSKTHRLAYVREYATALGLDPEAGVAQFRREEGLENTGLVHPRRSIKLFPFSSISAFVRSMALGLSVLLFGGYLVWQIRGILQPPKLMVYAPLEGYVLAESNVLVQGETEKESKLMINGQEIMVTEQGAFETKLDLPEGVNTLIISATKKHGKITTVVRNLVVKPRARAAPLSLK